MKIGYLRRDEIDDPWTFVAEGERDGWKHWNFEIRIAYTECKEDQKPSFPARYDN